MSENAIELRNVSFAYEDCEVLRDVTVDVGLREFLCLVGPNGGGKTTLLRLALGQLKPGQGEVRVLGNQPEQARNRIGYVPQHFQYDPQFPVRVLDVALMGRLNTCCWRPYHTREDVNAAYEALRAVELQDLAQRPFSKLSGGQRQRVLIARSLSANPLVLLLDEPTANVDTVAENMIYGLLQKLNEKICIVMVTHDLVFVSRCVKAVAFVSRTLTRYSREDFTAEMFLRCFAGHFPAKPS